MLTHSRRQKWPMIAAIGALLALFLAWDGFAITTQPARAATDGVMAEYGGWTVGTRQLETGEFVYCIEPGAITPSGQQTHAGEVDSLRAYSFFTYDDTGWSGVTSTDVITGEPLRRINYVLTEYGDTQDIHEAAAVQFAVWLLRDAPGEVAWMNHHIAWVEAHGGASEIARARELVTEAQAMTQAPPAQPDDMRELLLHTTETHGQGIIDYPAGTTELRITGGVFTSGAAVHHPSSEAGSVGWVADLHTEGWNSTYNVDVAGSWQEDQQSWPARLRIYPSIDPNQQTLAWAVGPVSETTTGTFDTARYSGSNVFEPQFSTRVIAAELDASGAFADSITITVPELSAPWPSRQGADLDRIWMPLTLEGVLYGPFDEPQEIQADPHTDAPVVDRLSLVADAGPGVYEATSSITPTQSGYYYWVWTIAQSTQPDPSHSALLPDGYQFSDAFGLPEESHHVQLPEPEIIEPPTPIEHPERLAQSGFDGAPLPSMILGMLPVTAGILLLSGARRRRNRNLQQPFSANQ